jgi:hypothetical protein
MFLHILLLLNCHDHRKDYHKLLHINVKCLKHIYLMCKHLHKYCSQDFHNTHLDKLKHMC